GDSHALLAIPEHYMSGETAKARNPDDQQARDGEARAGAGRSAPARSGSCRSRITNGLAFTQRCQPPGARAGGRSTSVSEPWYGHLPARPGGDQQLGAAIAEDVGQFRRGRAIIDT